MDLLQFFSLYPVPDLCKNPGDCGPNEVCHFHR
jgi:hypothetical protein